MSDDKWTHPPEFGARYYAKVIAEIASFRLWLQRQPCVGTDVAAADLDDELDWLGEYRGMRG